tara:strand:+ start:218 stop:1069 length:852 start_codon:yes stop_codon:yes gene_type:complete
MKNLDTLVDDIYTSLEPLSRNESLAISDEEIERTGENIKEALRHWARPSERNASFTIRMSNLGRPFRQLWFEKRDDNKTALDSSTLIRFLYGHILEEVVLMLARLSGHSVTDEQKEVTVDGIKGHIDCKIDGEIIDVKTASRMSFNKFKSGGVLEDDPFGYIAQLTSYEEAEGTDEGGFLVISKDSGELCLFRPELLDKPNIKSRIKKLKTSLSVDKPPPLCYAPVKEGKKGNMKLPRQCAYCNYKFECHKDSNDGEGLRTFNYAKGPVYFTKVVSAPRVEEV